MLKRNSFLLLLFTYAWVITGCKQKGETAAKDMPTDTLNYVNLTVLLDLSNRIDSKKHPQQIERDTLIIKNILDNFAQQVKRNGYIYSRDRIQILIAPQAENKPVNFNPFIDVEEIAKSNKVVRQVLPELESQFMKEASDIYSSKQIFSGADIYTFFKDFPEANFIHKSYEEKSPDGNAYFKYHNKMIILTDGYLNFEPNIQRARCADNSCMQIEGMRHDASWLQKFNKFKLKPIAEKDFQNLEVLLLEVNPIHPEINIHESDIIENYWKQWFMDMNIGYIPMHQANEGIPLVNSSVRSFLTLD